ncbi:alpha/beta hydrolase [Ornithinibacillus salinisoli]|uniref:Alpha/beta hydrolase n=1 Tax=Ornithinibacillus salinisoli TaxID=1848459 RepID=A0ABW4VYX9_9BACI
MGKVTKYFHSNIFNKSFEYHLLKPDHPINDANILYVQDGNDYLELGEFEEAYRSCELASMTNWIIIFIHPGTSEERWQSYHHKGQLFNKYIDFMYEEFMPSVEQELDVKRISKKGLLGDSLAANISLHIAARKPEHWTHLLLQSAAIMKQDIACIAGLKEAIPWNVYQTVGIYEDEFVSPITNERLFIYTRNRELHEVFQRKKVNVHFSEMAENHLWEFWKRDLPSALLFFLKS